MKLIKIIAIALAIIIAIMLIKFRPAYSVSLNGEDLGYVGDEEEFKNEVNENILTPSVLSNSISAKKPEKNLLTFFSG